MKETVKKIIDDISFFLLDMDGTVYLGNNWIDGAREFLSAVKDSGRRYSFLTNNSSRSRIKYIEKLAKMGLDINAEKELITSTDATIWYIRRHYPGKKAYILGTDDISKEFSDSGIEFDSENPEIVITTFAQNLDYRKMCEVCDFVRSGLPYIATHPDFNCPTDTGFIPDLGAISAFINASTERYPDIVIGKPNSSIVEYALEKCKADRTSTAIVGDRLYTDIRTGNDNGITSLLVFSGETSHEDVKNSEYVPTLSFESVKEIIEYL